MASADRDLVNARVRPPRFEGGDNGAGQLRIGLLVDWLDSRPEQHGPDAVALRRRADRGDPVALAAAALSGRLGRAPHAGELAFTGHNDHWLEYGASYHASICGHLDGDELAIGRVVYQRLAAIDPSCLSASTNLAEIERRDGNLDAAASLLDQALERASGSTALRYRVPDSSWITALRCARARLATSPGEGAALVALANAEQLPALVESLRAYGSWDAAAPPAHRAFAVASPDQRVVLHAAMRLAPINPRPPPAAHASFGALAEVEALVGRRR
jgi:hypothetical protein